MLPLVDTNKLDAQRVEGTLQDTFGDLGIEPRPLERVKSLSGGLEVFIKKEWN